MKGTERKAEFPVVAELSFEPLLSKMKSRMNEFGGAEGEYFRGLMKRAEVLIGKKGGVSEAMMKKHEALIQELMRVIFPYGLTDNEIKVICSPWSFEPFYSSRRFAKIVENAGPDFQLDYDMLDDDEFYIAACATILGKYYQMPLPITKTFYFDIPNIHTGRTHYYRVANNADFVDVRPVAKAPQITEKDYQELLNNFHDIDLWKKKFPKDSWIFSGFMLINMMDLTRDRVIGKLSNNLLNSSEDGFLQLQADLSELLQIPVKVSFVSLQGTLLMQAGKKSMEPMMLGTDLMNECADLMCSWTYGELIDSDRDVAVPDVDLFASRSKSKMALNLKMAGLKSYYATSIVFNGVKLGYLELGSETKGALNSTTSQQLEDIMPILELAANRGSQEYENRIEAVIQSQYTTIHPSVKWRFVEEANHYISSLDMGTDHSFENLVFKDVHPLYGQLDIRNSSVTRNEGIKKDLQTQLRLARKVMEAAMKNKKMPLYQEMLFVIDSHDQKLEEDLASASEQEVLSFLNKEAYPIMKHLASLDAKVKKAFEHYEEALHPVLHFVYQERRLFDESVNKVNQVLSKYIDEKQLEAQDMFPHHFERYATDGLEFNMYIGESISPGKGFHHLLVKNLRLWQLMVMVEMEREYHDIMKTMPRPLSVASLVLAFSNPLSIQYRLDEKQFDVEGAYNARYEIIKKRIDKAHIKGTDERITEPGKLVVVYTTEEDGKEYLRYFEFLQSKGYLENEKPEILTLEDLQGVSGLKAIRLAVNYTEAAAESEMTMEDIMAEIEGKGKG